MKVDFRADCIVIFVKEGEFALLFLILANRTSYNS